MHNKTIKKGTKQSPFFDADVACPFSITVHPLHPSCETLPFNVLTYIFAQLLHTIRFKKKKSMMACYSLYGIGRILPLLTAGSLYRNSCVCPIDQNIYGIIFPCDICILLPNLLNLVVVRVCLPARPTLSQMSA